ncbi:MAG: GMC family oxidoreductase N-terminal domain-containing protein [Alphaproteobacteria bacterium]|nr:GMC family oxidoreductase N-terminal domain-containing protein [Alphaproteobacteria bacterium]MBU0802844.1 GMC family oxidoreductase N-terminal domain-containing protein [Alphaproteobacteria bacterium]MBU0871641.1 GMC family oxidoreductase N-terminal domain-containing protein [Alphaproteobacteria bacterium]MBU1400308.1 GMC family oxidoreductase N-terminal domain-containing protein [Alphaproteobacteria bacterium]MBU1591428.1 GMC family oxidoreductase N-terminal domain-containing protein [Alph
MKQVYDYIIVGGGSSGCVAAARLVSDGKARVLVLEGGHGHRHPMLDMPPGIFKMIYGSKFMRYHQTVPQEHLDGRVHDIPQGNVLGGGSSVNAQVYMRGVPSDYEEWHELLRGGNDYPGWSWDDVLPHFRGMEGNNRLQNDLHGSAGPLLVSDPGHINEVSRWFVQSVQALGLPYNHDFNGPSQRGVGFYQFMNRNGKRSSAAYAFLGPLEGNPNLEVKLHARVSRIEISDGVAVGVTYRDAKGREHQAFADREVIVSAGSLVTPQLLMLSGIGPADHLAAHGINCIADLPGVGANLIDHPEVPITALANGRYGYHLQGEGWRMLANGLQFKIFGSGPITSAGVEAGAFVNPVDPDGTPSIQAFCVPIVYLDRGAPGLVENSYGFTVTTVVTKPKSRGTVQLRSADPSDMPLVSPNLLKHPDDMQTMVEGQKYFLRAFHEQPLAGRVKRIAIPSPDDTSDAAIAAHCRRFVKTNFHPSGTCRMGPDGDKMAVLDARLRVRGIERLRVCDLSAMPNINSGNTNAPAMMLGSRCAELALQEATE